MSESTTVEEKVAKISKNGHFKLPDFNINFDKYAGRGGAFIITPVNTGTVFTREKFSEEHSLFASTAIEFGINRILPVFNELNVLNKELSLEIFKECGKLGFLGVDIPEEYGGLMLDKVTSCLVTSGLASGRNASINVTISAHSGIATLPIVWYGNEEQKKKYLPKLASGEWMSSYALTEPEAGSDAMAGQMTAKLNDAGTHYILNGQKIFITNGSWCEVCITFAKVDGSKYTSFIIDKSCKGWIIGEEEHKLGIKGSSTTTMYFENCEVPIENVLGEVGEGGAIAFNGLYVGRLKLGASCSAGAKLAIAGALEFANERKQFNRPIAKFGMLQKKFAEMVVRSWEGDTIVYMTAGSIDLKLENESHEDPEYFDTLQKVIEDHGIEASVTKIIGSVALWRNIDEGIQILGGVGFIEEYPFAAMYRDERVNRIFEGTNEINRLIIGGTTLKKAILEEIPIRDMIRERKANWNPGIDLANEFIRKEAEVTEFSRSMLLYVLNELILKYGQDLKNEQWLLEPLANMVISLAVMDTGFKRVRDLESGSTKLNLMTPVMKLSVGNQYQQLVSEGKNILALLDYEDKNNNRVEFLNSRLSTLGYEPDIIGLKRLVVEDLYKHKKYYLD